MYSLYKFNYEQIKSILAHQETICIFLGVEYEKNNETTSETNNQSPYSNPLIYNRNNFKSWFAIDIVNESHLTSESTGSLFKDGTFFEGNFLRLMSIQDYKQASIIAQARSIICWLDRNKYCASCGHLNELQDAGCKLACMNLKCKSNDKSLNKHVPSNIHYPRVDPVAIMLIISPDNEVNRPRSVLLGRKKQFPKNMFSCLAGFVEAGESIEEAVRRESFEEAGVYTDRVVYHSSQPWPFPSTLMIGFLAYVAVGSNQMELNVDKTEIEEAKWFSLDEIKLILTNEHPDGITIPSERSIAHQLIKHWSNNSDLL